MNTSPAVRARFTRSSRAPANRVAGLRQVVGADHQGRSPVHAVLHRHPPEHPVGVPQEVGVDPRNRSAPSPVPAEPDLLGPHPVVAAGRLAGFPSAQDQQVGDHLGARRRAVRAGRQPDRADKVGGGVHLAPGGRVLRVHRERGRQDRDHPARPGQLQDLTMKWLCSA